MKDYIEAIVTLKEQKGQQQRGSGVVVGKREK